MTSVFASLADEHWLDGAAGRILTRHWEPDGTPRASLVMCHGIHAHGGHNVNAAAEFARRGYAVTVLDLRGRGRSDGERFYIDHIDEYVADVSLTVDYAKAKHPELPLYLLGHSAGGVTSVTYALDYQDRIDGLISESFAFRVFAPNFALKLLEGASHFVPHAHVLKLNMADFSRDPDWVAQLLADPLIHDESQPVAAVAAYARAGERFEREFGRITLPVLIIHGTGDKATRPDGSEQFHREAGSADKTLKLYEGHYHDLLNDLGKEEVIEDIDQWIGARLPQQATLQAQMPQAT